MSDGDRDQQLLEVLCCPSRRGEPGFERSANELRREACGFSFPIVGGIPVFFPLGAIPSAIVTNGAE